MTELERHRRWWEFTREEIYAYRTRKPHSVSGAPLVGRHWAYVGRTNDPERRNAEHLYGGGRWQAVAKPWADLEPHRFVIFPRKRRREITTHFLEWLMIKVLLPVYNVSMNGTNPRRIRATTQHRQRAQRDLSPRTHTAYGFARAVAGVAFVCMFVGVTAKAAALI